MSTVGTITKLATEVVGTTLHAVTHPVQTVTTVAGRARGLATAAVGVPEKQVDPERVPPSVREQGEQGEQGEQVERQESAPRASEEPEEIRTPAGTTAAAPGYNPDTAESDLHQPDTEPLMDPSLTKKVKAEADMMRKAAEQQGE